MNRLGGRTIRGWIPSRAIDICLLKLPDWLWGRSSIRFNEKCGSLFPGVRQFCCEADHWCPCSVEVNEWNYSSTPRECLHGVCKENFFTIRNSSPLQNILYFRSSLNIYEWKIKSDRTVLCWHVLCLM